MTIDHVNDRNIEGNRAMAVEGAKTIGVDDEFTDVVGDVLG